MAGIILFTKILRRIFLIGHIFVSIYTSLLDIVFSPSSVDAPENHSKHLECVALYFVLARL
jgi:hypothetical protein